MTDTRASSSSSDPVIAVTGATGALGGVVARTLADAGQPQRLVVRDAGRAPVLPAASVAVASYGDRADAIAALQGVDTLLMVSAAEAVDRLDQHRTFVDAAREAGVRQIVYTSFQGASPDAVFTLARDHWATERHIVDSGLEYTFLRDSFYLDVFPMFADENGVIRGPAGEGRVAAVARDDVAAAASAVLLDPSAHAGRTYTLTGSEAVSLDEVATRLTAVFGRPFSFVDESLDEAYASRAAWDPEPWQADAWVSTYTSIGSGEVGAVTTDVRELTGREPLTIETLFGGR